MNRLATNALATAAAVVVVFALANMAKTSRPEPTAPSTVTGTYEYGGPVLGSTEAAAGKSLTREGITIAAGPLVEGKWVLGEQTICTTVDYINGSNANVRLSQFDWKLQNPDKVITNSTFGGSSDNIDFGEIAPGGHASGDVCFEGILAGRQLVTYKPSFWSKDQLTWVN